MDIEMAATKAPVVLTDAIVAYAKQKTFKN
jgi:hypothetical protein